MVCCEVEAKKFCATVRMGAYKYGTKRQWCVGIGKWFVRLFLWASC